MELMVSVKPPLCNEFKSQSHHAIINKTPPVLTPASLLHEKKSEVSAYIIIGNMPHHSCGYLASVQVPDRLSGVEQAGVGGLVSRHRIPF
jgi:hypothetical protein